MNLVACGSVITILYYKNVYIYMHNIIQVSIFEKNTKKYFKIPYETLNCGRFKLYFNKFTIFS